MAVLLATGATAGTYSGGTGEPNSPYQIATPSDLDDIDNHPNDWSKHFILTNDIDMAGYSYSTALIAPDVNNNSSGFQGTAFTGTFDGNGYVISNLTINAYGTNKDYLGLFGQIGIGSCVTNLGLENVNITGGYISSYIGGLCGYNDQGDISNCHTSGSVSGGDEAVFIGGLCGYNDEGPVTNCHSNSSVSGGYNSRWVGGLCGDNKYATLNGCTASGSVAGGDYVGGLCGRSSGVLSGCYANGSVTGGSKIGGLCGENRWGQIRDCNATGSVQADSWWVGGLCGFNVYGNISDCYASGLVWGEDESQYVGGLVGQNWGNVSNCYATGQTNGAVMTGGLVGEAGGSSSDVSNCFATGDVNGIEKVGGLVGSNDNKGSLLNCYSRGDVNGVDRVGGLVGYNFDSSIRNCYSTGDVNGTGDYAGGLLGYNLLASVSNCFWDIQTSGMTEGVGNMEPDPSGVIGKTTAEMQTKYTFTSVSWDFTGEADNGTNDIWRMCVDGVSYPLLWWQFNVADFLCPDGVDFIDYSFFANYWMETNCTVINDCNGTDLNFSGNVDANDLRIFCNYWLEGTEP